MKYWSINDDVTRALFVISLLKSTHLTYKYQYEIWSPVCVCQVLANNSWIQRGWTNNNAESYNHVLKNKTNWKQMKTVNTLVSPVADLVQLQMKDLQRALHGAGNFILTGPFARHHVSYLGPPIPVSRYTEYRDTATNLHGINTGIEVTEYRHGRYWRWPHRQCGQCPSASFRMSMNAWSVVTQLLVTILLSRRLLLPVPASLSLSVS